MLIKTAKELLKLSGLPLARYIKGLRKDIAKLEKQKPTDRRIASLKSHKAALEAASKKTSGKAKPKTGAKGKSQDAPATEQRIKALNEKMAKTAGRPTTAAQRAKIRERIAKKEEKAKVKTVLDDRTRVLTPEGQALYDKADKPSLRKLRNDLAKGDFSRLSYPGGRGTLKSKAGGPDTKAGERRYSERMAEEIDERLQGTVPPTRRQAAKQLRPRGRDATEEELKDLGGFEFYKKGGLKKFQSRVKYSGKEYAYVGGGMVSDISHFKPKKKTRKK